MVAELRARLEDEACGRGSRSARLLTTEERVVDRVLGRERLVRLASAVPPASADQDRRQGADE
jgi:hypothetical protein